MTILAADFEALSDSLGVQYLDLRNIPNDTHALDVQTGAVNNVGRVEGLADTQAIIDLLAGARAAQVATLTPYNTATALWGTLIQALNRHVGTFNAYLAARTIQVSPDFAALVTAALGAGAITAEHVFDPVQRTLATFAVTGSGAGTYTAGATIDTTRYGAAPLQVHTTSLIGAASLVATLHLTLFDGTTTTRAVTIPSGTASGTDLAVGDQQANPTAAPALSTSASGGTLPPGTYQVAYTWTNTGGETQLGPPAAILVPYSTGTPANTITVGAISLPGGATGVKYYVTAPDGAVFSLAGSGSGGSFTVTDLPAAGAAQPPTVNGLWAAYVACTNITITGGTAADAFGVRTVAPRTPAR